MAGPPDTDSGDPVAGRQPSPVAPESGAGAEVRTFLIADVRGYTSFTAAHGDEAAGRLAGRFAELTRAVVADHQGRLLELRGDEALVVFTSARAAIRAALALQDRFVAETLADPSLPLPVGIGLDAGEAVAIEGGYRGGALNLAARLCSAAGPGEVLASQEVTHLARHVEGVSYRARGRVAVKGLAEPVPMVAVLATTVDPARQAAFRAAVAAPRPRRRVATKPLLAAALALAVAASAGVVAVVRATKTSAVVSVNNRVDVIRLSSAEVVDQVLLGSQPSGIAAGAGALWAANAGDGTVARLDPGSRRVVDSIEVGGSPGGLVVADGFVWVTDQAGSSVAQISPSVNKVVATVAVGNRPTGIAAGAAGVWVATSADGTVTRIDPHTGRAGNAVDVGTTPTGVAETAQGVWVTNAGDGTVSLVDPRTATLRASYPVGNGPAGIAAAAGSLWVANDSDGTLARLDPATGDVTAKIPVGNGPTGVAAAGGDVWVTNQYGATIVRVDPRTNRVDRTVAVGGAPHGLAVAGGALWVTAAATGSSHRGGTLTVFNSVDSIDPAISYYPESLLYGTYDGLVGFRRSAGASGATLVPDLATSIPTPVDGGKTYAFRLREGIRYSTGAPVLASDFRRGIERLFRVPTAEPAGRDYFAGIRGAEVCRKKPAGCDLSTGIVTDDTTRSVTFRLLAPDPEFLDKLALSFAVAVPAATPDRDVGTAPVPATGPYKIVRYVPKRSLELVRNPYFREWSRAAQPDGYPDRILVRYLDRGSDTAIDAALNSVLRGQADLVTGEFPGRTEELSTRYAAQLHRNVGQNLFFMAFNTSLRPFNDPRARQAVNYAVDREQLVRAAGGTAAGAAACQVLPPAFPGHAPYCPYPHDLTKARELVAQSGTAGAAVTVLLPNFIRTVGPYLVGVLNSLHYRARLEVVSNEVFFPDAPSRSRHAQMTFYGWFPDYPAPSAYLQPLVGCRGTYNLGRFCDPAVEALIQAALALQPTQPAAAGRLWQQVDRAVVDRAALLPMTTGVRTDVTSQRVGNYQAQPVFGVLVDQLWVQPSRATTPPPPAS